MKESIIKLETDPATAIPALIEKLSAITVGAASGEWPWMTGPELATAATDTAWIAPNLIPLGASIQLDGQVKDGKTTFVNALVRACCTDGGMFLDEPVMRTPVVFLSEQGVVSSRYQARQAGLLELPDFHIMHAPKVGDRKWPAIAAEAIKQAKAVGAKLIIVDNPAAFAGMKPNEENDSASMIAMLKPILAATADGITVLLIRHQGYSGHSRGSTALSGGVDIVFSLGLHGERDNPMRVLTQVGRFDTIPARQVVERLPGGAGYKSLGNVAAPTKVKAETLLLAAMPTSIDGALTREELLVKADDDSVKPATAKIALKELVASGQARVRGKAVRNDPHRYWRPS
jgi:hypothetical protein